MYRQSIQSIKVVILPLDGIILDLNRYRYNYYHHLCDQKKITLNKNDFYSHLSNMYDMYTNLPLSHTMDVGPFNAKVERELFQYLSHKGISPKEGCLELIEYLHQKEISIVVISTHRTKDAVEYLKMVKLYNKVHFIIGSDTTSLPLPSTQILETVMEHFHVQSKDTLVISPFLSLNKAAYSLHMNIIYCEDLMPAQDEEIQTSYKTVKSLFEVLNTIIFDQYEDAELYSPILGMNSDMSKNELDNVKNKLEEAYQDDEQLIDLVNKTYAFHLSQLNEQKIKDASVVLHENKTQKRFYFDDDFEPNPTIETKEKLLEEKKQEVETDQYNNNIHFSPLDPKEEDDLTALLKQINKKEAQQTSTPKTTDYNEIEKIVMNAQEDIEEENEDEEESLILSFLINIVYIGAISFLIIFIGLLIYIAFIHQFDKNNGIFRIIGLCFHIYYGIIESVFRIVLNSLHALIYIIPTYNDYISSNNWFSQDGMLLFNIFVFQIVVIVIIKMIMSIIRRFKNESFEK